jgi:MoaA/NifB/PqqE/SkfB family radical SAM enzyme
VLEDLIADAAVLGYQVLAVSGGEPFMYPHLPALLSRAKAVGLQCLLTSNGTLVTPRRLAALDGCLDLLVLSLDGPRAEHDRMRGRDGAYDAMTRRIDAVRESGIPFGFLFTLTQHNVHQLEWAAGFAAASGAALLQVHPLEASGRGRSIAGAVPDAIEASYALLEVGRLRRQFGASLRFHLDVAASRAFAALLRAQDAVGGGELSRVLSPLVVEPDGWCVPLTYGFPRYFALGNVNEERLPRLAESWLTGVRPALREVAADLAQRLDQPGAVPVINGYERLTEAALTAAAQFA